MTTLKTKTLRLLGMENSIKCGITVDPPTLIIFYKDGEKLRKKAMPLRSFKKDSNCIFLSQELKKRYELAVPQLKIEKLLRILQELMKGTPKETAVKIVEEEQMKKQNGNLNKLSTLELDLQKEEMEIVFSRNQVKPGDPDYKYDKQVDFQQEEESGWDRDVDDDFWK